MVIGEVFRADPFEALLGIVEPAEPGIDRGKVGPVVCRDGLTILDGLVDPGPLFGVCREELMASNSDRSERSVRRRRLGTGSNAADRLFALRVLWRWVEAIATRPSV